MESLRHFASHFARTRPFLRIHLNPDETSCDSGNVPLFSGSINPRRAHSYGVCTTFAERTTRCSFCSHSVQLVGRKGAQSSGARPGSCSACKPRICWVI